MFVYESAQLKALKGAKEIVADKGYGNLALLCAIGAVYKSTEDLATIYWEMDLMDTMIEGHRVNCYYADCTDDYFYEEILSILDKAINKIEQEES